MSTAPLTDLLRLSLAERIQLVEDLWDSVAAEANEDPRRLSVAHAQLELVKRRSKACLANPDAAVPLEEALERIERSLP
jgi:putative addiction module component (TIGR02574 family)